MGKDILKIVCEHNSLNGFRLVIVEFLLVAIGAGWICVGEGQHHEWLGAMAGIGMMLNAMMVVTVAVRQWRARDQNIGIVHAAKKALHIRLARENPDVSGHTLRIVVYVLVPFLLVGLLAQEGDFRRG